MTTSGEPGVTLTLADLLQVGFTIVQSQALIDAPRKQLIGRRGGGGASPPAFSLSSLVFLHSFTRSLFERSLAELCSSGRRLPL